MRDPRACSARIGIYALVLLAHHSVGFQQAGILVSDGAARTRVRGLARERAGGLATAAMGAAPARRRGGTLAMSEDSWAVELRQASGAFIEEEQRDFLRRSQAGDGNVELNAALLEWLQERGVWVSELSGWNVAPHKLALSSATIDEAEGETSGRGLLARDSVEEGKELFVIPIDLCITKAGAQAELGADVVPDTMNEFVADAAVRARGAPHSDCGLACVFGM